MGKEKKCILCEIVCSSAQDMDEHMRSMLHHRELENLRGRDSGHECRVCGVTVMALTEYADHISSPVHKQRVEAHELKNRGIDHDEEYFDKELVQLIEKRKEQIRIQEAAAKREREEEEKRKREEEEERRLREEEEERRKRQEEQQRRQQQMRFGTKPWLRQNRASWDFASDLTLPLPSPPLLWWGATGGGSDVTGWQKLPIGGGSILGEYKGNDHHHQNQNQQQQHPGRMNKSATWHAEVPPNFQTWSRADGGGGGGGGGGNQHGGWQIDVRGGPGHLRGGRGGGGGGGRYEGGSRDNLAPWQTSKQPTTDSMEQQQQQQQQQQQPDCSSKFPKSFSQTKLTQPSSGKNNQKHGPGQDHPKKGHKSRESSSAERDRGNKGSSAAVPKLDKLYRWAPYPPSKVNDQTLADGQSTLAENDQVPSGGGGGGGRGLLDWTGGGQQQQHRRFSSDLLGDRDYLKSKLGSSQSRGSSTSNDSPGRPLASHSNNSSSNGSSNKKNDKSTPEHHKEKTPVTSPAPYRSHLSRAASQDSVNLRMSKQPQPQHQHQQSLGMSRFASRNSASTLASISASAVEQERMLSDMLRRAKETLLDNRSSAAAATATAAAAAAPCRSEERRQSTTDTSTATTEPVVAAAALHIEEPHESATTFRKVRANRNRDNRDNRDRRKSSGNLMEVRGVSVGVGSGSGSERDSTTDRPSLDLRSTTRYASSQTESPSLQSVQVSTSTAHLQEDEEDNEAAAQLGADEGFSSDGNNTQKADAMSAQETCDNAATDTVAAAAAAGSSSSSEAGKSSPLPASLKRDLGRHIITTKGKAGPGHEPNLNNARRIRNVSGTRKAGEGTEKDSVALKPIVRDLISSTGSRRNVNWDQVYQDVSRKKQEKGKGQPRFGIEMVSRDQETAAQEDEPLCEGYQWDSLLVAFTPPSSRKRSLSESSLAPERPPIPNLSLFSGPHGKGADPEASGPSSSGSRDARPKDGPGGPSFQEPSARSRLGQASEEGSTAAAAAAHAREYLEGDSSCVSGAETESHTGGKKRRAAGEVPTAEIPFAERQNKRRKLKCKKERSHVDQLLAVSLKEEELSGSLQAVDQSLVQARATLQAAYMEVQRLLVLKQQVTMEMSTLRSKRIELLKGMKDDLHTSSTRRAGAEETSAAATAASSSFSSFFPETWPRRAAPPSPLSPTQPTPSTTATATSPLQPSLVVVKQEPLSPPCTSAHQEPEAAHSPAPHLHSTTPELPAHTANYSGLNFEPVPVEMAELRRSSADLSPRTSAPSSRRSSRILETAPLQGSRMLETAPIQSSRILETAPIQSSRILETAPIQSSRMLETAPIQSSRMLETAPIQPPSSAPPPLMPPPLPSLLIAPIASTSTTCPMEQAKAVKKVRKLKKKRMLRQAQGSSPQQPAAEQSDTESDADLEASRMLMRKLRPRRRASGGSHVSTSTPPAAPDADVDDAKDEKEQEEEQQDEEEVEKENDEHNSSSSDGKGKGKGKEEAPVETMEASTSPAPPCFQVKLRDSEAESSELEVVELEQVSVDAEVISIDISEPEPEPEEEDMNMEVGPSAKTETEPQPLSELVVREDGGAKEELRQVACDEVTSTSEMPKAGITVKTDENSSALTGKVCKSSADAVCEAVEALRQEPSEGAFEGHQEAVHDMQIHDGLLYTCSGDKTVRAFRLSTRECVSVFEGHTSKVNCILLSSGPGLAPRLYSGSSDQTVRCYSLRTRECVETLSLPDRVLCLHSRWKVLFVGLANGSVVTFSLKTNRQLDVFECHGPRAVSCLATAQEGARRILLVGSYDSSISVRDAKNGLLLRTLQGHTKTVLCMKVVNDLVFSGSSDQSVHAHNIHTGELVRIYKGHSHAVTVVAILGKVMVTACLDKLVRVYELQSHDRLQVYGGHSDMVMCMVIHKSMIYTGCYDGSVRAVKLNLIQNYRCLWHGCSLIFGVLEHLQQHVLQDHAPPSLQTLKCRWKTCDAFFSARNGSKQGLEKHMLKHCEDDSKMEP
ncbi:zinc finger protein 106 [Engraulis encrasicolus]|uniref:zinc finger protein 106 n=1 Tax=Engraulis encrasicolus TaxID=184585 RepID=UPI002FD6FD4F